MPEAGEPPAQGDASPRAQATPTCAGHAPPTPSPDTAPASLKPRPRPRPGIAPPGPSPKLGPAPWPRPGPAPPRPAPELTTCNYRATKLLVGSPASGLVTTWPHPDPSSVPSILRDPRLKAPTPPRALTKPIKNQVTLGWLSGMSKGEGGRRWPGLAGL